MTIPSSIVAEPNVQLSHHRIHEGFHFAVQVVGLNLQVVNPKYILIPFPPIQPPPISTVIGHLIYSVSSDLGVTTELFEDAVISSNGTPIPIINLNRNSPVIPLGSIFEDPIVITEGTRLFIDRIGTTTKGGIGGPTFRDEDEILAKIGSKYLIKITPLVNGANTTTKLNIYSSRSIISA